MVVMIPDAALGVCFIDLPRAESGLGKRVVFFDWSLFWNASFSSWRASFFYFMESNKSLGVPSIFLLAGGCISKNLIYYFFELS